MDFLTKIAYKILKNQPAKSISDEDLEYFLWICGLYKKLSDLPGHIAEIGVGDGRNAMLFGRLIFQHGDQSVRQYIGFDTFCGFLPRDLEKDDHLSSVRWKENSTRSVLDRVKLEGVSDVIELIEGDVVETVPDTLKNFEGKKFQKGKAKFALLYIDCNAYIPAIKSMEAFLPHMVEGGIIAVDEKLQGSESEAICDFAKSQGYVVRRFGGNSVPMAITMNRNSMADLL